MRKIYLTKTQKPIAPQNKITPPPPPKKNLSNIGFTVFSFRGNHMKIKKVIHFTICLLLIGLYLSCEIDNNENIVPTAKNSDNSLIVIYNNEKIFPDENNITILLAAGADLNDVKFTLEVGKGAALYILQDDNKNLPLNENNQYPTTIDFSDGATHDFIVIAQDESIAIYNVKAQLMDSKEISSFTFLESDHSDLKENIVMAVNTNSQTVRKTVTNVEGITHLIPTIVHSGSNISPASKVAQDFSTNNTYTVTAFDGTESAYTVILTNYYGVTFNGNGGLISGDPTVTEYILYGEKIPPPSDPSREHYGFKGWYDNPDEGNVFNFNDAITNQTIVYARWTNKQYTVSFDTDGGSVIDPVMVNSLTPVARPADPITNHYVLEGWYMDNSFTALYDFNWKVSNDFVIYAKYANKQYTVSFDTDNGGTIASETVNSLTPVNKPMDLTKEHYVFDGWYMDNSFTTQYDFSWAVSNHLTLYAKYTNKQYQVRFYQGGNPLETILVTSLATISVSNYPVNPNAGEAYRWHSNANLGGVFDKDSLVIADFDLYAQKVPASFEMIIENRIIPTDLTHYGKMSEEIFSNYPARATVISRYVTPRGNNDGSSWANASGDMRAMMEGISDASADKIYVVLIASGTYDGTSEIYIYRANYVMKNHVALIGGFTAGSYDQMGVSFLSGNNDKRVFYNNDLDRTALLYGVTIINGNSSSGGGMHNSFSSPTLINVTFQNNIAIDNNSVSYAGDGGGMFNWNSSPTLINVTFSDNTADRSGGGMRNAHSSSPTLINVTFSGNEAQSGGGMFNTESSPTLNNVIFSDNEAQSGGGMDNWFSFPTLIKVTFSDNTADKNGGGMFNYQSSPTLNNVAFSGNTAANGRGGGMENLSFSYPTLINATFSDNEADFGGGMHNDSSYPTLINVTFSGNRATDKGGGVYHDGDELSWIFNGQSLTLINTILWNNDNGNIYVHNNHAIRTDTVNLYYSVIEGGTNASNTATGIRLYTNDTNANPININSEEAIDDDPGLGTLFNNGGEVDTISIGNNSPAKDKGVYVRGVKIGSSYSATNLYYSKNNTDWYSDPGLTTQENPPNNADDFTATDARGYGRVGRPDMGAYEEGGVAP